MHDYRSAMRSYCWYANHLLVYSACGSGMDSAHAYITVLKQNVIWILLYSVVVFAFT